MKVERDLPLGRAGHFEAQHQHGKRIHGETPDHAESVGFAQYEQIAAGDGDGDDLQDDNQIDEPAGGPEAGMRMAEPIRKDAVFGHAVQYAVRSDDGCIHRAGKDQRSHQYDERVKQEPQRNRAGEKHRQPADEIVEILGALGVRDNHHGEERDQRGEQHAVNEDHESGSLQILELGISDLAIDLRQALLAAHGQQGMAQSNEDRHQRERTSPVFGEPSQGARAEPDAFRGGQRDRVGALRHAEDRDQAPHDQDHHHHRGDLHDAQRLLARFMNPDGVFAPEIQRDDDREQRRKMGWIHVHAGQA